MGQVCSNLFIWIQVFRVRIMKIGVMKCEKEFVVEC